jgi:hypothetical protein
VFGGFVLLLFLVMPVVFLVWVGVAVFLMPVCLVSFFGQVL